MMVIGIECLMIGEWKVVIDQGDIVVVYVVNVVGFWVCEVGCMVGVELLFVFMEYYYFIIDDIFELKVLDCEILVVVDFDGGFYLCQEYKGILFGVYECEVIFWVVVGMFWDYVENEFLIFDFEWLGDDLFYGFMCFFVIVEFGIKWVVNGFFMFMLDGNLLVGLVKGLLGYWVVVGCMVGFVQGGGIGCFLVEWMIDGQLQIDVFGMDIVCFDFQLFEFNMVVRVCEFYL